MAATKGCSLNTKGNTMATIATTNKGAAVEFTTDKMGSVTLRAVKHKGGKVECFVMREEEGYWKPYGEENAETIITLAKHQLA
jgi:hypothetical protein